jgi:chaperonin GroES
MATATSAKVKAMRPLDDRIVVKPSDPEEKTAGGIVLPDTAKEKPQRGEVISVGPGKMLETGKRAPMLVKVGDVVLYGKYSGSEVEIGSDKFVIMRESDVLAVVVEK